MHYWKVFSFTELKFFFKTGFYSVTKTSLELGVNLPQLGVKRVLTVDACFYRPVLRHSLSMILARGFGHSQAKKKHAHEKCCDKDRTLKT